MREFEAKFRGIYEIYITELLKRFSIRIFVFFTFEFL